MKNLKKRQREWALDSKGWCLLSENSSGRKLYDISKIDEEVHKESTFYKEQWIDEDKLEQRLIVTYSIKYKDVDKIAFEEAFDGFFAVCTNLEDDVASIIRVNNRRLEIEEFFRKMKCEFKAKPDYAKRDMRMKAHFTTCFASLLMCRILEKRLNNEYTYPQKIKELRDMYFLDIPREGFIPAYVRTDFTDALHDAFGFRTDYRILTLNHMKNIYKLSKK
jgi:transposase